MKLAMEVTKVLRDTASALTGYQRRMFMARTVRDLFAGVINRAVRALDWDDRTLIKGKRELSSGIECLDGRTGAGRPLAEVLLPNLMGDLRDIADSQSQTDPRFKTQRLYTRITAAEVRRQLIAQKGYTDETLPTVGTIGVKLNELGYRLRAVAKTKPKKKIPETDAIFEQMTRTRTDAALSPNVLELSLDAKAVIKVGEFSRYGVSRIKVSALDHDHGFDAKVTPYGFLLPAHKELTVYLATGQVTADFIVDRLDSWWCDHRGRFPGVDTLLLLQDNGPENQSRRTQFLGRIVAFTQTHQINVRLAYYPPYHSKYNPVERCWGVLEQHWNGSILDTVETIVQFTQTMAWKGTAPIVQLVTATYAKGISLTRAAMAKVEAQVRRLAGLEPWFVDILCAPKEA